MSDKMNTKDFLIGSLIGGIVGASAAFLFAPKSGRELRQDINEQARAAKDKTSDWTNQAVEKGSTMASTAARSVTDQSTQLIDKVKKLALSVRKDMQTLSESADYLADDLNGISEDIAASVRQEVEDLQRSVEQLVKEVEQKEQEKKAKQDGQQH
ncbi:YtxH domain-containing protein [Salipaludibacillus agaradhaerens]|jgi:gas vesicle protein|uniref:YtxH domain-containing protein n=1 Tax=Salipaludibacillus agaradhaerens TaxID=76935 RepID=UPI002151F8F5|nr:YtxH domain-containing protein [Salipaludibacillus agaradhaerens]MCR6107625.1 YtxH domain-containing protein [Salipaludibacillus agaradhaerens]MCR6119654.1 YtxH domain-containing protein [Salipaludibacillus agaradhaerens]UJW58666.1 YtxH domain-containing protein [Bacillus sp. A116_S68]